jgi:hypothetical protein
VGPRAGLDDVEKRKFLTLPGLELRTLGRPARSQPLYRLGYGLDDRGVAVRVPVGSSSSPFSPDILHRTLPSNTKRQVVPVHNKLSTTP